jgi:hypothetical protein
MSAVGPLSGHAERGRLKRKMQLSPATGSLPAECKILDFCTTRHTDTMLVVSAYGGEPAAPAPDRRGRKMIRADSESHHLNRNTDSRRPVRFPIITTKFSIDPGNFTFERNFRFKLCQAATRCMAAPWRTPWIAFTDLSMLRHKRPISAAA